MTLGGGYFETVVFSSLLIDGTLRTLGVGSGRKRVHSKKKKKRPPLM